MLAVVYTSGHKIQFLIEDDLNSLIQNVTNMATTV